jgi:hypothetical protein
MDCGLGKLHKCRLAVILLAEAAGGGHRQAREDFK